MPVSLTTLYSWLAARSIARGLPAPVCDHGGYRVDTHSDTEICRWVFARPSMEMGELARAIDQPGHFIKLCGSSDELRSVVPSRWRLDQERYFMTGRQASTPQPLPHGYTIEIEQHGMIRRVAILNESGDQAAGGYAVESRDAFIYDRIETAPTHRRKGLGSLVMASLAQMKRGDVPELLVATNEGRLLYEAQGWHVLSPYATASISDMSHAGETLPIAVEDRID